VINPMPTFRDELSDLVCDDAGTRSDLSGCTQEIGGKLRPRTGPEVVRIVQAAARHGVQLHPISCGRNWGFGSALPTSGGAWIVDLASMTRIDGYDAECGSICIQPGVTQGMLYRSLVEQGNDWFFNLTGAGESTSVLGNALERGVGYYGQRQLDLVDLQVVTGTGDVVWTRLSSEEGHGFGASLGTDITQLFCQAGMGIVISARLRLIRRTNGGGVVIARLKDPARAGEFFQKILALKQEGCIAGIPHIGNRERIISTMSPWLPAEHARAFADRAPSWTAALPLLGRREMAEAAAQVIQATLAELSDMEVMTGAESGGVVTSSRSPMEMLQQLACGFPSNLALPSVQWSALGKADVSVLDPEKTEAGLIHVTPAVRSSAPEIERILSLLQKATQELDLAPLAMTVNVVDSLTTVLVISVPFVQGHADLAQQKARRLQGILRKAGVGFYRLGLVQDEGLRVSSRPARKLFTKLKRAFDPAGVFAPSKYEALFAPPPKRASSKNSRRAPSSRLLPQVA